MAGLILFVGAGATQAAKALRGTEAKFTPNFAEVPMTVGEYRGRKVPVDREVLGYLQATAMEDREYQGKGRTIRLSMIYATDWRSMHAPTGCYPAQGWQIVHNRVLDLPAPPDCPHPGPLQVRVLDATKGKARDLAMYVYARPGATTADWATHALRVATGPRGAGGMIVILRTQITGSDVQAAESALKEVLTAIYPKAVAFWYAKPASGGARAPG